MVNTPEDSESSKAIAWLNSLSESANKNVQTGIKVVPGSHISFAGVEMSINPIEVSRKVHVFVEQVELPSGKAFVAAARALNHPPQDAASVVEKKVGADGQIIIVVADGVSGTEGKELRSGKISSASTTYFTEVATGSGSLKEAVKQDMQRTLAQDEPNFFQALQDSGMNPYEENDLGDTTLQLMRIRPTVLKVQGENGKVVNSPVYCVESLQIGGSNLGQAACIDNNDNVLHFQAAAEPGMVIYAYNSFLGDPTGGIVVDKKYIPKDGTILACTDGLDVDSQPSIAERFHAAFPKGTEITAAAVQRFVEDNLANHDDDATFVVFQLHE